MKKLKNKNAGITLIALIITIIVLLILAGVSIASITGDNGVLNKANKARVETDKATVLEQIQLAVIASYGTEGNIELNKLKDNLKNNLGIAESDIEDSSGGFPIIVTYKNTDYEIDENGNVKLTQKPINPEDVETGGDNTWTRANGLIEIEFLTGTSYTTGNANTPLIDDDTEKLVPVNWDETNKIWIVTDQANWDYSYGTTDTTKKWANVMLRDTLVLDGMDNTAVQTATIEQMKGKTVTTEGSMLVWLPRYAYRILYFDSETNESSYRAGTLTEETGLTNGSIVGYSDARGLVDAEGKTPEGMNTPVTSIAVGEKLLRPHPAFEDGSETGHTQGEWDTKLTGIWMGKFETTEKVNSKITIRPNTASYVNKTIGTFYTDAQNLGIANSHMAKNSEWGAMEYLTESKYGRDGVGVTSVNGNTGGGDYKTNILQSTTGNVFGIYDTTGINAEYVTGYLASSSKSYGNSFASTNPSESGAVNDKTESTKYATVYRISESNTYDENTNRIFGDATIETSTQSGGYNDWYGKSSFFINSSYPFFTRGYRTGSTREPVMVGRRIATGNKDYSISFRLCGSVK